MSTLIAIDNSSIIMFLVFFVSFTTVIKSLFQGSSSQLMEESNDSKLGELVKPPFLLLSSKKEEAKPAGYWKRVCKRINTVFFIFYIIAASVFLVYMAVCWNEEQFQKMTRQEGVGFTLNPQGNIKTKCLQMSNNVSPCSSR